jgi:hypothetical protein
LVKGLPTSPLLNRTGRGLITDGRLVEPLEPCKNESVFLGEPNVITLRIQPDDGSGLEIRIHVVLRGTFARCPSRRRFLLAVEDGAIVRTIVFFALAIIDGPTPGLSANQKVSRVPRCGLVLRSVCPAKAGMNSG